jgi:hypothetical protein
MIINGKFYSKGCRQFVVIEDISSAGIMANPQNGLQNIIVFNSRQSAPMAYAYQNEKEALAAWYEFCNAIGDTIEKEESDNVIEIK